MEKITKEKDIKLYEQNADAIPAKAMQFMAKLIKLMVQFTQLLL